MASKSANDYAQTVDARDIDGEPFGVITSALADLESGETMLLVNSFEPAPLYNVIEDRGMQYDASQVADDEWHVEITNA